MNEDKTRGLIRIPLQHALPPAGVLFAFAYEWVLRDYNRGFKRVDDVEMVILMQYAALNQPSFEDLALIIANGGYFENINLAIELQFANINDLVPESVVGAMVEDRTDPENPIMVNRTWEQWVRSQYENSFQVFQEKNDNHFIFNAKFNGKILNSIMLLDVHQSAGVKVIELSDYAERIINEDLYQRFEL